MLHRLLPFFILTLSAFAGEVRDISAELEAIRAKYHLPACASAVVENGRITAMGANGLRRADRDVPVTTADIWPIASCTKSLTATLVGVMVDAGKLRWDMPIPETLPGVPCAAGWSKVTLWHLVTQRSGIAAFTRPDWSKLNVDGDLSLRGRRANFARMLLVQPPAEPPGKFAYSNSGYALLGVVLEHASGESYEDLLKQYIFAPLELKSAGFGAPATPGEVDQPWGHRRAEDDRLVPVDPSAASPFFTVLAPAGSVHMSLADFARYAAWLSTGQPRLVKEETFAKLQTPPDGSTYAGGLWKSVFPGVGGEAVCHTGHVGGFFAVFYASPNRACVSVFNNEGGGWEWLGDEITAAAMKAAQP